jgi:hypothetical protein
MPALSDVDKMAFLDHGMLHDALNRAAILHRFPGRGIEVAG